MSNLRNRIEDNINGPHGYHMQGVMGDENSPSFIYTIGLSLPRFELPELLMVGIGHKQAGSLIQSAVTEIAALGRLPNDLEELHEVSTLRSAVAYVDPTLACERYMFLCKSFLGHPPAKVLQLVWPDTENVLPWERGCDIRMADMQSTLRTYREEVPQ